MKFQITHQIQYTYDKPVFIEPMSIRMRPRCDCTQRLENHTLHIHPQAAVRTECIETDGNSVTRIWFQDLIDSLQLTAESTVETLRQNPFDYLLDDPEMRVPPPLVAAPSGALQPYLNDRETPAEIKAFIADLCPEGPVSPIDFLNLLTNKIHKDFEHIARIHGDPWEPTECLAKRQGACRDLAMLFAETCRSVGLAARFVSGYCLVETEEGEEGEPDLHAWTEVYLPGGGWRGYDPSIGITVADNHVALAAAAHPSHAAAASGSFRGTAATSQIDHHIEVKPLSA